LDLAVSFCNNLEFEGDVNTVVALFEGEGVDGQTNIFDFNTFASDNGKVVGDFRRAVRKRNRQIAYTVAVCTAVKDPLNFNANCLFEAVIFFVH
jgi:hypothetical protein